MAAAPLDPVTLADVVSALIGPVPLVRLDARVLQLIAVLDAGAHLPMLLHHQFLHIFVVAVQQRLRERGRLEALRRGGVAVRGGVRSVAAARRARPIVRTAAQILRATAAARPAPVYRRHTFSR